MTRARHARPGRLLRNVLAGMLAGGVIAASAAEALTPAVVIASHVSAQRAATWQQECPQATWKHILWFSYSPSCPSPAQANGVTAS